MSDPTLLTCGICGEKSVRVHSLLACVEALKDSRDAAEERGRRRGVEEAQLAVDAVVAVCDLQQDLQYRNGALMAAEAVRVLVPRDSAPSVDHAKVCDCGGSPSCTFGAPCDSGKVT